MTWLTYTILLFFSLESVLGGYSTGLGKTLPPKTIVDPPAHPKQRFIGHHEGSIGQGEIDDHQIKVEVIPDKSSPTQVEVNEGGCDKPWLGDDDKRPVQPNPTRDLIIDRFPPKDYVIEEEPIPVEDHPKVIIKEEKPGPILNPPKVIQIEENPGPIVDHPKDIQIEKNPGPIVDHPKDIQIEKNPGPIVDHPKDIQIEKNPGPIVDHPKDIQIEENPGPIVDHPKVVIEEKPVPVVIPPKVIQIEENPGPIIDHPKVIQVEEKPAPVVPYPIKVTNENSNLNLYEMLQKLQLSRFVHLVEEAGLEDLFSGNAPITIFAPSDSALSKLKADEIKRLATDRDLLRQFVLYHCVDGSVFGSSLVNDPLKTRIDRNILLANFHGEKWYVNGREIKVKDQVCKNGAIHVIDYPLYPFPQGGILETLEESGNFKIFCELIRNAKLDQLLKDEYRWTIFAPTDAAFSKLPPANVEWLKWDIPAIKRLFDKVTCRGYYYTSWINSGSTSPPISLANESLDFSGYPDTTINGIRLSQRDITADNGCIHAIDDMWFTSDLAPSETSVEKKD